MLFSSAEAKTSAGAPSSTIAATSSDEAAKLSSTSSSGYVSWNSTAIASNASVNDAAANTLTSPDSDVARADRPVGVAAASRAIDSNTIVRRIPDMIVHH